MRFLPSVEMTDLLSFRTNVRNLGKPEIATSQPFADSGLSLPGVGQASLSGKALPSDKHGGLSHQFGRGLPPAVPPNLIMVHCLRSTHKIDKNI